MERYSRIDPGGFLDGLLLIQYRATTQLGGENLLGNSD